MLKSPKLTLSQEDFPANPSPQLIGIEEDLMMNVVSSQRCLELSMKTDPLGLLEKKLSDSKHRDSIHCSLNWKKSTTPQGRSLSQLVVSRPHIDATEYSWSPTPMAMDGQMTIIDKQARGGLRSLKAIPELGMGNCWINPEYAEWLMGFPKGWTNLPKPVLKPLEMR